MHHVLNTLTVCITWASAINASFPLILSSIVTSWTRFTWSSTVNIIFTLILNFIITSCTFWTCYTAVNASFTLILYSIITSRASSWKKYKLRINIGPKYCITRCNLLKLKWLIYYRCTQAHRSNPYHHPRNTIARIDNYMDFDSSLLQRSYHHFQLHQENMRLLLACKIDSTKFYKHDH